MDGWMDEYMNECCRGDAAVNAANGKHRSAPAGRVTPRWGALKRSVWARRCCRERNETDGWRDQTQRALEAGKGTITDTGHGTIYKAKIDFILFFYTLAVTQ